VTKITGAKDWPRAVSLGASSPHAMMGTSPGQILRMRSFPDRAQLTIGFAHAAYRLGERFALRATGLASFEVRTIEALAARIADADVLVVSGLWRDELIERAGKLCFVQSISAGVDQFSRAALKARGIRLASAQGVNERAVAEHAMALILALSRQLHLARDRQAAQLWRGLISDLNAREDELDGKTLLIVGLGRIGSRLAKLAAAFGMRLIATKRDPTVGAVAGAQVVGPDRLGELLPQADIVVLTCPLTADTEGLIDASAFAAMKRSALLINVARGRVVNEGALVSALERGEIAGAGLDGFKDEPLASTSPLWRRENVLLTPHTAGETRRYEDNVIELLLDNLDRLWRGDARLRNEVL
jgi:D-2-hydroxyacid dehydrogenase (NADP+)